MCVVGWISEQQVQIILCLTARTHSRTRQQDEGGSNPGDNCELESKLELELELDRCCLLCAWHRKEQRTTRTTLLGQTALSNRTYASAHTHTQTYRGSINSVAASSLSVCVCNCNNCCSASNVVSCLVCHCNCPSPG